MFSYESFSNRIKKYSKEKINAVIYCNWYGNTIAIILTTLIISELLMYTIGIHNPNLFYFLYIFFYFFIIAYICTRKAGLALSDKKVLIVKFRHIGYKEKEVHEVEKDKIKSVSVHKFLYLRFISLSFISNSGKLEQKKLYYSSYMPGSSRVEYKKNGDIIYEEMFNLQKKLERGDF